MTVEINLDRDYAAEMRQKVDELAVGTYFPPMVAHKIVGDLRNSDPELLWGWLYLQAEHMIRDSINDRDRSARSRARFATPRSVFGDAVDHAARTGSNERLERWLSAPFSLSTGVRMSLRDMDRSNLLDVSRQYETRAETQMMMATFFRVLSDKVGDHRVADVCTEEELATMYTSLAVLE